MKQVLLGAVLGLLVAGNAQAQSPQDAWWAQLQGLCGKAFAGKEVWGAQGSAFAGQDIRIHVRECTPQRIRVPLVVGDDRSRTWVFTRSEAGITLRHDHRHADGSEDTLTQYGGTTVNRGSAQVQVFPGDQLTADVIPGSGISSVWQITLEPGQRLIYAGNRVGTARGFQIDFDLSQPVDAPPAPWGW
ncbi:MAG: hypothetical protein ACI4NW_06615 [Stenotrophomonas sp.]